MDGDPTTAWTAAFGSGAGSWIGVHTPQPLAFDTLELDVAADGRHSLPATVTVEVDGQPVGRTTLGRIAEGTEVGHVTKVTVPLERPVHGGTHLRVVVDEITPRTTPGGVAGDVPLPVAVAEIRATGMPAAPVTGRIDTRCRADLATLDGRAVPIRVTGMTDRGALGIEACGDVELGPGTHRLRSSLGEETGLDIDAVTLRSREGGGAAAGSGPADPAAVGADLVRASTGRTRVRADIDAGNEPFWFVLGQSRSSGWELSVDGGTAGPPTLVDGYANGWLVTPDAPGRVVVSLTWTPQRQVWLAMGVSAVAIVLSALILLRTARAGPLALAAAATPPGVARGDAVSVAFRGSLRCARRGRCRPDQPVVDRSAGRGGRRPGVALAGRGLGRGRSCPAHPLVRACHRASRAGVAGPWMGGGCGGRRSAQTPGRGLRLTSRSPRSTSSRHLRSSGSVRSNR